MNRRRLKRVRLVFAVVLCLLIVIMLLDVDNVQPPPLSRDLDQSYGQRHRWHVGLFRPFRRFHNDTVPSNVTGSEPVWIPSFPKPDASFRSESSKDAIDNDRLDVKNSAVRLSKQMDYPKELIFVKSLQEAKDMLISFDGQKSSGTLSAKNPDLRKSELHSNDGEEIEEEISGSPTQEKQQLQRLIVVYEKPWFVQTSTQVDFTACDPSTCTLSYDPSDLPSARAVVFDALRLDRTTPPPHPRPPGQLWVLYFLEPPPVLKRHEDDVLPPAWRGVFNLTWSYRSDSDIFCPYGAVVPKNSDDNYWRRLLKNDGANVRHGTVFLKRGARARRVASGNDTSRERLLLKTSGVLRRQSTKPSPGVVPPGRHRSPKPSSNNAFAVLSKGLAPSKLPHSRPDFSKLFRTEPSKGDDEFGDSNSAFPRTPSPHFLRVAALKTRGAVWLVSHCGAESARDQYVERLQRRLDVDVYGRCSGQRCGNNEKCMSFINTTYRFYLSFENTFCTDYITEKAFNVYNDLNVIPVVRGGANYSKLLPSGTYIDASDFPSPEALGDYLVALGYDRVVYAAMLEKKHRYRALTWSWQWPLHWCQLCELVNRAHTFPPGSRIYPDIAHWITHRACWPPRDLP